jgi:hypothetical protein
MATLLDVFTIGFNSEGLRDFEQNLKNNEKELDKYQKRVKDLEWALDDLKKKNLEDSDTYKSIKADLDEANKKVKLFGDSVKKMKGQSEYQLLALKKNFGNLMKTVGLIASVGVAVKKSLQFYEEAEQLDFLAQKAGIAVEKLQELGNAAQRFGGTTEGSASSVENIRTNKEEYAKYGIRTEADPTQTLENVARKMETLKSDAAKWDLANSLGIDEGTTRLLIQGVERYREEMKRASKYKLYTKEDIERMRDYRQVQQDIRMGTEAIFGTISRLLLPAITAVSKAIRTITDWLAEHEGAVKIIATFVAVTVAITGVISVIKLLNIAIGFLLANPVVLTIIAIITAITVLITIVQDFIVFLQGGDSLIGDILKRMGFNVEEVRQNCLNFFNSLKEWITGAIDWIKSLGGKFVELANKLKSMWDGLPEPIKKLIGMSNPITGVYTAVTTGQQVMKKANNSKMNAVPAGASATYNQTQAINENNNKNVKNTSTSTQKVVNINSVNIQTQASDPKGVANAVNNISEHDNGLRV